MLKLPESFKSWRAVEVWLSTPIPVPLPLRRCYENTVPVPGNEVWASDVSRAVTPAAGWGWSLSQPRVWAECCSAKRLIRHSSVWLLAPVGEGRGYELKRVPYLLQAR